MEGKTVNVQLFDVLSPWSEVDPVPPRGISPRLQTLEGKKIGMFSDPKRAARPILDVVEQKLKEKFPTLKFTQYSSSYPASMEIETKNRDIFKEWVQTLDAFIGAVGD